MGYLRAPHVTRQTMTSDGWLKSGDLGFISEVGGVSCTSEPCLLICH